MADAITDAMIEAGRDAWDCNMGTDPKAILRAIFLAMEAARQPQLPSDDGLIKALEAADKRLCELTPNFPPDVGPDMRDAEEIEKTGAVVMQIREALSRHKAPLSVAGDDVALRGEIMKLALQYESQAKFADHDYATHFRDFARKLRALITKGDKQ